MTSSIHVVHVLHSLAVGGTENGAVNLICQDTGDIRHTVVAMTETGPLASRLPTGVGVHCLGKQPGWDLRAVARLAARLRKLRPQVVHSRNWGAFDAVVAARLVGVPVVIHGEHGREIDDPSGLSRRRNRLRRILSPLIDRFVAVSEDLRGWLIDVVGIPAGRVLTIHNGVDARRFSEEGREAARAGLGLGANDIAVGTVGRLDPIKDQMGLLEAFARLGRGAGPAGVVIVGDGACRAALEARAQQPDLRGRVQLLGERSDVPQLLRALDVFVLPSIAEGISNTILEAMATGLPVIATRTGGNPELVDEDVTGALVPVGDREALARSLAAYLAEPHLRQGHGKAGRQRVLEHFGMDRMAGRYHALYRGLMSVKNR